MPVQFETVATAGPTDVQFTVWASLSENIKSGPQISWSSDADAKGATWMSPTSNIGDIYDYLAMGTITVPLAAAGPVTIIADGGQYGWASTTIAFASWGANPTAAGVVTPTSVTAAGGAIQCYVHLKNSKGEAIAGAEVQWRESPVTPDHQFNDSSTNPLSAVSGGWWCPITTDAEGYARVYLTSNISNMVAVNAVIPGMLNELGGTAYFATTGPDSHAITVWPAPDLVLDDGLLNIVSGQQMFFVGLGPVSAAWAQPDHKAFLYLEGADKTVPWSVNDARALTSEVHLDLSLALIMFSSDTSANKAVYYVQDAQGRVIRSYVRAFGAGGTPDNAPDPTIADRPFGAPVPDPDPGGEGYINPSTIAAHGGLMLKAPGLGAGYTTGKVMFNYYLNGTDEDGDPKFAKHQLPADQTTVDPSITQYTATLPAPEALNYESGVFYGELVWFPDMYSDTDRPVYSQYCSYVLDTRE